MPQGELATIYTWPANQICMGCVSNRGLTKFGAENDHYDASACVLAVQEHDGSKCPSRVGAGLSPCCDAETRFLGCELCKTEEDHVCIQICTACGEEVESEEIA